MYDDIATCNQSIINESIGRRKVLKQILIFHILDVDSQMLEVSC